MQRYSVGKFNFEQCVYAAEASDLGLPPGAVPREIGITHRSGVVERFVFNHMKRDVEGDIVSFNYVSVPGDHQLRIFND